MDMKDPNGPSEDGLVPPVDPRMLVGLCLGLLVAPQAVRAGDVGCVAVVRAEGLGGPWARAVAEIRQALADRDDVDRCVEIVVTREARGVRLIARLPAGGDATRLVDSPDDLGPTILALVLVPARPAPGDSVESPPAPVAIPRLEARVAPEPPTGDSLRTATAAPVEAAASANFEVGAAIGARWQGSVALGVGGFADVALGPWLVGASGQWSTEVGDQTVPADSFVGATVPVNARYRMRSLEIGVELGRRFLLGPVELTALLGPRVAMMSYRFQSEPVTVLNMAAGEPTILVFDVSDRRVARIGGGLRARWAGSARLQLVFGIDASVEPSEEYSHKAVAPGGEMVVLAGPPPRPSWAFALTLGGRFQVSP
jgi:hypothetical protein